VIVLHGRPSDSLNWTIPPEGDLFFRFDLGLEDPSFPWEDEMHFQALTLALTQFTEQVWPNCSERIKGALLYRGHTPAQADTFAYYCQMLAYKLPDELPLWLHLDVSAASPILAHQTLSSTRFEHFKLAVKGLPSYNGLNWEGERNEAPLAICFPEETFWTDDILKRFERLLAEQTAPFRVIHERLLTEEWEGVETLLVLEGAFSGQGERKLTGFQASGGEICLIPPN